ncbi:MAG: flagellar hook capping protein [Deltaproteobacteria bacterium]|nr:flagellar hook capping protein [Deltaproteobacteria bacterium]
MTVVTQNQITQNYLPVKQNDPDLYQEGNYTKIGKDEFLKLLIAQMKYQDPLNPIEGTEFTAQLAQFTSLEQLYNINDTLEGLNTALTAQNSFQAVNLLGKTVKTAGQWLNVEEGELVTAGVYELKNAAQQVQINIYSQDGAMVHSIDHPAQEAGTHQVEWDGRNFLGQPVPDGIYAFEVVARNPDDSLIDSTGYTKGTITGLTFGQGGEPILLMNGIGLNLANVIEIIVPKSTKDN